VSVIVASPLLEGSVWTVFWFQLPALVLVVAVVVVATIALRRARPEDVPKIFEAFVRGFGRAPKADRPRRDRWKSRPPRHSQAPQGE